VSGDRRSLTRICMTEWPRYYDSPESDFRKRFALYEQLGVDTIRVETGWLGHPSLVRALKDTSFRLKLILYVLGAPQGYRDRHPDELMLDERGERGRHVGPWCREFAETTLGAGRAQMLKLQAAGLADRVDEVVADLGPAAEAIYPANWTLNRSGEQAYWCYSERAQASFREAMAAKYHDVCSASEVWGVSGEKRFAGWSDVVIPMPQTDWAKGAFWDDMLTWYRDSKRRMIRHRIAQTQALASEFLGPHVKCIVYLPGHAYSQADWDAAVREASGPVSIRLMMDNDWLMQEAIERGCVLQYTGVEYDTEVREIVGKLKEMGSDAYAHMWGENAGIERCGRAPQWLAQVITGCGLRGVDFTWSNWLFEDNGTTPSGTYAEFAHAVRMIRHFYDAGEELAPQPGAHGRAEALAGLI